MSSETIFDSQCQALFDNSTLALGCLDGERVLRQCNATWESLCGAALRVGKKIPEHTLQDKDGQSLSCLLVDAVFAGTRADWKVMILQASDGLVTETLRRGGRRIGHDMNNSLGALLAANELLQLQLGDTDKRVRDLIDMQAGVIDRIRNQVLDLMRLCGKPEEPGD